MDDAIKKFIVSENTTLIEAIKKIESNHQRVVFIGRDKQVIGVISDGDVLRALLRGQNPHVPVKQIMHVSLKFLTSFDYQAAFKIFQKHLVSVIPIVDDHMKLEGVITLHEIMSRCKLINEE